jgi:hypothetical protein
MSDDRRKPGFRLNRRTDAEIKALVAARESAILAEDGKVDPGIVAELAREVCEILSRRTGVRPSDERERALREILSLGVVLQGRQSQRSSGAGLVDFHSP